VGIDKGSRLYKYKTQCLKFYAFFAGTRAAPRERGGGWPGARIKPGMLGGSPWCDNYRVLFVPRDPLSSPAVRTSLGWGTIAWTLNKPSWYALIKQMQGYEPVINQSERQFNLLLTKVSAGWPARR
jgi:hypothetical protein